MPEMKDKELSKYHKFIIDAMTEKKVGIVDMGEMINEQKQSIYQRLNNVGDFKISKYEEMLAALGYKIDFVKVGYQKVCPGFLDKVMERLEPTGLFFTDCYDGAHSGYSRYLVVDNRERKGSPISFPDEEMMMGWLEKVAD